MNASTESRQPFIFYLTLDDALPREYYHFSHYLKELGFILIPVKMDQIQSLISLSEQDQVIILCSVNSSLEFKNYNLKVRKYLKHILKSKRLTFMHLSCFDKVNDQKLYHASKNYFFIRFPVNAKKLSEKIARFYDIKKEQRAMWPGGKRSRVPAGVV